MENRGQGVESGITPEIPKSEIPKSQEENDKLKEALEQKALWNQIKQNRLNAEQAVKDEAGIREARDQLYGIKVPDLGAAEDRNHREKVRAAALEKYNEERDFSSR
jgi:hypothetical protein